MNDQRRMRIRALKHAYKLHREAQDEMQGTLRDLYPVGTRIAWKKREDGHVQHGIVTDHGHFDGVRVTNEATDRTYWTSAYWILKAEEQPNAR